MAKKKLRLGTRRKYDVDRDGNMFDLNCEFFVDLETYEVTYTVLQVRHIYLFGEPPPIPNPIYLQCVRAVSTLVKLAYRYGYTLSLDDIRQIKPDWYRPIAAPNPEVVEFSWIIAQAVLPTDPFYGLRQYYADCIPELKETHYPAKYLAELAIMDFGVSPDALNPV